jgi:hypothetical protein
MSWTDLITDAGQQNNATELPLQVLLLALMLQILYMRKQEKYVKLIWSQTDTSKALK